MYNLRKHFPLQLFNVSLTIERTTTYYNIACEACPSLHSGGNHCILCPHADSSKSRLWYVCETAFSQQICNELGQQGLSVTHGASI